MYLSLTDAATIAAALAHYRATGQGDPRMRTDKIHHLATQDHEIISLDDAGIDELLERANAETNRLSRPYRAQHTVHWTIELTADSPRHAAERALEIHRDPTSTATVFGVETINGVVEIDLSAG